MASDVNKQMNQLISIRGSDTYQASIHTSITQKQEYIYSFGVAKSKLKFALANGLVDEFVELIEEFIENNTGVDINKRMTINVTRIKNLKKLKHKECPKILKPIPSIQDLNTEQLNEKQNIEKSSKNIM
ncbi:6822_t:CDS:1, partial [Dentiscutata erythropus]